MNTPQGLPRWALAIWTAKLHLQRALLAVLGATLVALVFTGVISRYLLNTSIFWIEEAVSFTAIALYFIGAAHATWSREHISASLVELVFRRLRTQQLLAAVASALSTLLCGWMAYWAWVYLQFVIRRGTVSLEIGVPMAWVVAILPTTLALMTLYFAVETVLRTRLAVGRGLMP